MPSHLNLSARAGWTLLACAVGVAGCASPPRPDGAAAWLDQARYSAPSQGADAAVTGPSTRQDDAWWREVGGEPLVRLVDLGLHRNHDVALALTRVREARAGGEAQSSALWPTVSAQGARASERSGLPPPVKQGRPDTRALQATLNLDWELDVFGRARATARGAQGDVLASEAGVAGARLMLIGEVTRQHVVYRGVRQRLSVMANLVATQDGIVRSLQRRLAEGEVSALEVDQAQARWAELQARQRALTTLQAVTRARLMTLLDASATEIDAVLDDAAAVTWARLPPPVATGQPVALLARRPDLIAAQAQWQAEQARRDAAQTDLLPRFFVSLVTGRQDLRLNGMDLAPVGVHESLLAFSLPLFNAGRVRAGIERQDAVLDRAEWRYAQVVRQAVEEVESALVQARQTAASARDQAQAAGALQRAAARGARLFDEGQMAAADRLGLEQAQAAGALAHIDAIEAAWLAHVQLHLALGGGWQNAPAHVLEHTSMEHRP